MKKFDGIVFYESEGGSGGSLSRMANSPSKCETRRDLKPVADPPDPVIHPP
jgi:hypothetical protein